MYLNDSTNTWTASQYPVDWWQQFQHEILRILVRRGETLVSCDRLSSYKARSTSRVVVSGDSCDPVPLHVNLETNRKLGWARKSTVVRSGSRATQLHTPALWCDRQSPIGTSLLFAASASPLLQPRARIGALDCPVPVPCHNKVTSKRFGHKPSYHYTHDFRHQQIKPKQSKTDHPQTLL